MASLLRTGVYGRVLLPNQRRAPRAHVRTAITGTDDMQDANLTTAAVAVATGIYRRTRFSEHKSLPI